VVTSLPPQRDFAARLQAAHRSAGAASTKRSLGEQQVVDWNAVIKRFKKDMARRWREERRKEASHDGATK
jgi:hypothetical protein